MKQDMFDLAYTDECTVDKQFEHIQGFDINGKIQQISHEAFVESIENRLGRAPRCEEIDERYSATVTTQEDDGRQCQKHEHYWDDRLLFKVLASLKDHELSIDVYSYE